MAITLQKSGERYMELNFPDPLLKFKEAFHLLLSPKELVDIDINVGTPQIKYTIDGATLDVDQLSSGEKEVFSIVFDLLLRNPEDCVIFFDEPEMHLHPELSFRLLKTLQTIGARNQFIFCTHSADMISGALEHSVVFLASRPAGQNQAILIDPAGEYVAALRELGQSLGVISLGKRIVLIEGADGSIDRDTYGAILQGQFPEFVLAPSGSRHTILSFNRIVGDVLDKAVWGIDFYMLADRDNSIPDQELTELQQKSNGRLRFLSRYNIENYFLDENTIAAAFENLARSDEWVRDPAKIKSAFKEEARRAVPKSLNIWLSHYVRRLGSIGSVAVSLGPQMKQEEYALKVETFLDGEIERIRERINVGQIKDAAVQRWKILEDSLESSDDAWKSLFPGKLLIGGFCGQAQIDRGRFRNSYISSARKQNPSPFSDIVNIFESWKSEFQMTHSR